MASPRATKRANTPASPRSADTKKPQSTTGRPAVSFEIDLQAAGEVIGIRAPDDVEKTRKSAASLHYEPPVTTLQRRNTARLLPARYSDSVLNRIADTPEDLHALYELDNATNERLIAEADGRLGITAQELVTGIPYARIINAAFAHPHPQGARFSTPFRGAWYAGFELATAKAEVLFHRSIQLAEIGWHSREDLDYDHYQADFLGSFHDLRAQQKTATEGGSGDAAERVSGALDQPAQSAHRPVSKLTEGNPWQRTACLSPDSYRFSQEVAAELLEIGSPGVIYPSARRATGTCIACFRPGLVSNVRKRDLHRLSWFPDRHPVFTRIARTS